METMEKRDYGFKAAQEPLALPQGCRTIGRGHGRADFVMSQVVGTKA